MVDLTDVPGAAAGDPVVLWGGAGADAISANDVARLVQTISYELLWHGGPAGCQEFTGLVDLVMSDVKISRAALLGVSGQGKGWPAWPPRWIRHGVELLSTGGTEAALDQAGFKVKAVGDFTGFPEIFGGRVKTLHPRIHGGILGAPRHVGPSPRDGRASSRSHRPGGGQFLPL